MKKRDLKKIRVIASKLEEENYVFNRFIYLLDNKTGLKVKTAIPTKRLVNHYRRIKRLLLSNGVNAAYAYISKRNPNINE